MGNWQQSLGILSPTGIKRKFAGKNQTFYPISGRGISKVRGMAKRIGDAVVGVTSALGDGNDAGVVSRQENNGDDFLHETSRSAVTPEMARMRHEMRKEAFNALIDMVLSEDTQSAVAHLIMDSMREVFRRDENGEPVEWPSEDEFIDSVSAPQLVEGITGAVMASKGILGPFEDHLEKLIEMAKSKLDDLAADPDPQMKSSETSSDPTPGSQAEAITDPLDI